MYHSGRLENPYEGREPYLFVSYAHADVRKVMPVIEGLQRRGCRVWHDAGIVAGSEWPETIASHLLGSAGCLVFMSEQAVASHNVRREIHFAAQENLPMIVVLLDDVQPDPGLRMQLGTSPVVKMAGNRHVADAVHGICRILPSRVFGVPVRSGNKKAGSRNLYLLAAAAVGIILSGILLITINGRRLKNVPQKPPAADSRSTQAGSREQPAAGDHFEEAANPESENALPGTAAPEDAVVHFPDDGLIRPASGETPKLRILLQRTPEGTVYPEIQLRDTAAQAFSEEIHAINDDCRDYCEAHEGNALRSLRIVRYDGATFSAYLYEWDGVRETVIKAYNYRIRVGRAMEVGDLFLHGEEAAGDIQAAIKEEEYGLPEDDGRIERILSPADGLDGSTDGADGSNGCWWVGYDGIHIFLDGREYLYDYETHGSRLQQMIITSPTNAVMNAMITRDEGGEQAVFSLRSMSRRSVTLTWSKESGTRINALVGMYVTSLYDDPGRHLRIRNAWYNEKLMVVQTEDVETGEGKILAMRIYDDANYGSQDLPSGIKRSEGDGFIEDGMTDIRAFYVDPWTFSPETSGNAGVYGFQDSEEPGNGQQDEISGVISSYADVVKMYGLLRDSYYGVPALVLGHILGEEESALLNDTPAIREGSEYMFAIRDLDGDGQDELIPGIRIGTKFTPVGIYTMRDGRVARFGGEIAWSDAETITYICEENIIVRYRVVRPDTIVRNEPDLLGCKEIYRVSSGEAVLEDKLCYADETWFRGTELDPEKVMENPGAYGACQVTDEYYEAYDASFRDLELTVYPVSDENMELLKDGAISGFTGEQHMNQVRRR